MLVFGTIVSIKGHQVKLNLPEYDNNETDWFFVPQLCSVGDKSNNIYEIGTLVAAVCDEEFNDGCIIGALYNDEDLCITEDKNIKNIVFSDGTNIQYNKSNHILTLDIKGNANITAQSVTVNGNLKVNGSVSDSKGSMQQMRDKYNGHTHGNGNNGANTTNPNEEMN